MQRGPVCLGGNPFKRAINQTRKPCGNIVITQVEACHGTGREILHQYVGARDELHRKRPTSLAFDINGETAFVAVEEIEVSRAKTRQCPGPFTFHRFDLDYRGAQIGEQQCAARSHDGMTELNDADTLQRKF